MLARLRPGSQGHLAAVSVIALGMVALASRRVGPVAPAVTLVVATAALLVPTQPHGALRTGLAPWLVAVALGVSAFVVVRALFQLPPAGGTGVAAAAAIAGLAEEALFRRLFYDQLSRWGVGLAVVGSALAFGLVHVPAHGLAVLPLDVAAGLLFGWQRWASGSWSAPALTHVAANVVQLV
ncbi:MAG: CPBP family glutamic-type intramembrane protease [Actinomycetota bacterium]